MRFFGKVWGSTAPIVERPLFALHRIIVRDGFHCSWHKHGAKWNGFYCLSGMVVVEVRRNGLIDRTVLEAGDFTEVRPGEIHRFIAHDPPPTDRTEILEMYYLDALGDDIEREDQGGANGPEAAQNIPGNMRGELKIRPYPGHGFEADVE
jgi:mannose-6-phosphate isomerase-like protein (cupin superfamily)